ncbi:MAG: hypothetical protein NWE89_11320 [Candidatus Bathyarchaeota archaeon]|nr:hypothetical protein [Candidatus Bathyarchaeota archaeon]
MELARETIAVAITVIISFITLVVTYHGILTGVGVIPGLSFLLWTLIALGYATHEEIEVYVRSKHHKITDPLITFSTKTISRVQARLSDENIEQFKTKSWKRLIKAQEQANELISQLRETLIYILTQER